MRRSPSTYLTLAAQLLALFASYLAMAKLGIALPVSDGIVSPVWAPTGIALAALTLGGQRLWPAVFAAALVANATSGTSLAIAAGIAVGNTLEPAFGAWLLRRVGFDPALDRMRHLAALCIAGLTCCVVSATNGVGLLWLDGVTTAADVPSRWLLWWLGDAMGVLVAAPVIFSVATAIRSRRRPSARFAVEFTIVTAMIGIVSVVVFSGDAWRLPVLLIPLLVWTTLRFRALGSSAATLLVAAVGIFFILDGAVAFEGITATETVQLLQGMLTIVGLSMLAVAAALAERDAINARLATALHTEQDVARELRLLDETKDRLLAAVSHELRTPLTSILALSTLLEDRRGAIEDAKLGEMYMLLNREAHRLDVLLSDLLDLERLRLGMMEPRWEAVNVALIVQGVVDRHASRGERPTSVEVEDVHIEADTSKIERIVDNLVGNAIKHTRAGTAIAVRVERVEGGALIAVDDEGEGVPAGDRESIYEPFHRGSAPLDAAPGTGIGLSLVAHFTELHGGRAWVEDRDGGGASFRVFLPTDRR